MAANPLFQPLNIQVPIVDPKTGTPTAQFQRMLQALGLAAGLTVQNGQIGLADDGVTNAKLANMASKLIKARKNAAAGDPEDCTLSEVLDFIGAVAQGDIIFRDAAGWARLAAGAAGQFLKTNGAGANPAWAAGSGGSNYQIIKCYPGLPNAADTVNVNSAAYVDWGSAAFFVDLDQFLFTEFRIVFSAGSNQAGQTITGQLTYQFTPGTPIHTGGNDVVVTNAFGTFSSAWRSKDDAINSGIVGYTVALKGSNATVDLAVNSLVVMLRK